MASRLAAGAACAAWACIAWKAAHCCGSTPAGATAGAGPDLIGCRVVQGGDLFRNAVCVRPGTMRAIEGLVSSAPLHLPPLLALLRARAAVFAGVPMVLVFETSFFADLPFRENACALNAACTEGLAARRRGFHGILPEAACAHAAARRRARESPGWTCCLSAGAVTPRRSGAPARQALPWRWHCACTWSPGTLS